jgi:hypothetical protein
MMRDQNSPNGASEKIVVVIDSNYLDGDVEESASRMQNGDGDLGSKAGWFVFRGHDENLRKYMKICEKFRWPWTIERVRKKNT